MDNNHKLHSCELYYPNDEEIMNERDREFYFKDRKIDFNKLSEV